MEASLASAVVAHHRAPTRQPLTLAERLAAWRPTWMADGACRGHDTDAWFPERGESVEEARAVCAECPVRTPCELYALRFGRNLQGMFGGLSARERRAVLAERQERAERFAEARERGRVVRSCLAGSEPVASR